MKTKSNEKFRQYLQDLMKENKLNQITMSDRIGCNHSYISLLIRAKRKPTVEFIKKVCTAFQDQNKMQEFLMELV